MKFTNTSSHMVQEVTNIIDGYKMGSMRALAQEPVQNALDAVREGCSTVEVEYRLLRRRDDDGKPCFLLTVSDKGTTGLRGDMVSNKELEARNYQLKPEENWAAFEAQGYTKENEDALGSRGQGKAAFLYHSHVPPGETRRMAMLYDTLLECGEYRLGMRYARPVDQILSPPLLNAEAQAALQRDFFLLGDLNVPLRLKPLCEVGTRVIIPFVAEEDALEFRPGSELERWLQRSWWRAIQIGKLRIRVVDEDQQSETEIGVPKWWRDLPRENSPTPEGRWHDLPDGCRACVWGDLAFGNDYKFRRLVMLHSDSLTEDEIVRDHPEYSGIQVMRGLQWIETRGARQDFGDYIPPDKRPGFRGYVEFDKRTNSKLRAAENSQHDGFDARGSKGEIVRELRAQLDACTRKFSAEMGWETAPSITTQQVSQREKATLTRFVETFLNQNGRKLGQASTKGGQEGTRLLWDCNLDLDYPDPKSTRVDWGQSIRHVNVEVGFEPGEDLVGSADVILEWVDESGKAQELCRREDAVSKQWGKDRVQNRFELGDWQILRGKARQEQQIECSVPGECKLRAVVLYRAGRVKSASRTVYVQSEPPPPPEKNPVTLSISAVNISADDKKRIDHGEVLQLQINTKNRSVEDVNYCFTASFNAEDHAIARRQPITLEGTPAGELPIRQVILSEKRRLFDPEQNVPLPLDGVPTLNMPESSGKYTISADLHDENDDVVAHASCPVYFQRDPGNARNNLPFEIEQQDQKAMWLMNEDLDLLTYSGDYPLYKQMKEVQSQRSALQGRLAFIAEISANGLLEWALKPKETGDDSHYDQLYDESRSHDLWDALNRGLENLSRTAESPIQFAQTWRETVAVMLDIFARENN
ncbi:MAG: hypothetical protein OXI77_17935 [Chloroflexota bacterium]|nr:hypothetical protein [Chloroflexota bacterium]MDE2908266.1 hypothetical protein [Chloroflexota bacterium]